ncbi:uncharacterized protein LOC117642469, partial [Thrips palmi]|uniref:Uncharacterized protein LOC117642469 n=1 Tax=Thrips palmi TaxID=161013 RepID=A0A6P8ZK71_THRPL
MPSARVSTEKTMLKLRELTTTTSTTTRRPSPTTTQKPPTTSSTTKPTQRPTTTTTQKPPTTSSTTKPTQRPTTTTTQQPNTTPIIGPSTNLKENPIKDNDGLDFCLENPRKAIESYELDLSNLTKADIEQIRLMIPDEPTIRKRFHKGNIKLVSYLNELTKNMTAEGNNIFSASKAFPAASKCLGLLATYGANATEPSCLKLTPFAKDFEGLKCILIRNSVFKKIVEAVFPSGNRFFNTSELYSSLLQPLIRYLQVLGDMLHATNQVMKLTTSTTMLKTVQNVLQTHTAEELLDKGDAFWQNTVWNPTKNDLIKNSIETINDQLPAFAEELKNDAMYEFHRLNDVKIAAVLSKIESKGSFLNQTVRSIRDLSPLPFFNSSKDNYYDISGSLKLLHDLANIFQMQPSEVTSNINFRPLARTSSYIASLQKECTLLSDLLHKLTNAYDKKVNWTEVQVEAAKLDRIGQMIIQQHKDARNNFHIEKIADTKLHVSGYVVRLSEALDSLTSDTREINIVAFHTFILDKDFSMGSVPMKITVVAAQVKVVNERTINLNGMQGNGMDMTADEGELGQPGEPGGPAGSIFVLTNRIVDWEHLKIMANGGRGGPGQKGGSGKRGEDAESLRVRTATYTESNQHCDANEISPDQRKRYCYLTACGIGVQGQIGSDGGAGGYGGPGGQVELISRDFVHITVENASGERGEPGDGGDGGPGGWHGVQFKIEIDNETEKRRIVNSITKPGAAKNGKRGEKGRNDHRIQPQLKANKFPPGWIFNVRRMYLKRLIRSYSVAVLEDDTVERFLEYLFSDKIINYEHITKSQVDALAEYGKVLKGTKMEKTYPRCVLRFFLYMAKELLLLHKRAPSDSSIRGWANEALNSINEIDASVQGTLDDVWDTLSRRLGSSAPDATPSVIHDNSVTGVNRKITK